MSRIIYDGLIDLDQIDYNGIEGEVDVCCTICDPQEKTLRGIRGDKASGYFCEDLNKKCPFVITSNRNKNGDKCIAPSSKVFKKHGLRTLKPNNTYIFGKSHFFFFLYHKHLNWQMPPVPEKNRFGEDVTTDDIMTLEHRDGNHYNDSKQNLQPSLKSEHGVYEPNTVRKEYETLREAGVEKR